MHRDKELKMCDDCPVITQTRKKVLKAAGSMIYVNGTWIVQEKRSQDTIDFTKMYKRR